MYRRNIFVRSIGGAARKFRALQEVWILPWWGSGGVSSIPLWTLDTMVLIVKLCSTCVMAIVKVLIPPAMKSLHGETVLITGAGNGLGRELALQFAELGATVICWDNDARRNNAVIDEIRSKDGDCYGYTVDITVREQVASLAARMRRQLTDVSMVVSNAGALTCAPLNHLRPEAIARLIEVNLLAHFWIIQAFLPNMIERRHGHIIAINSSAGLMPCPDMTPYCAAKFGLRGLMDSLTEELRLDTWTKNINTTSVYLATVSTGLYPPPSHRFTAWYSEITAKEAARIIIRGCTKYPTYNFFGIAESDEIKSNDVIRKRGGLEEVKMVKIRKGMLRWLLTYVDRMDERKLTKQVYVANVHGTFWREREASLKWFWFSC